MTWFLYKQPTGHCDLTDHELNLSLFPGYTLIQTYEEKPDVEGKRFNQFNELVPINTDPAYIEQRRYAYPSFGDQMDSLWHAMNTGVLPKVEPFYSEIKAVKEQYPKA